MAARPALLVHRDAFSEIPLEDMYYMMEIAVNNLPKARKESYLAQAGTMGGHKITDILFTNSFQVALGDHDGFHYGNFPEVSLLNHDCRPNLAFFVDQNLTHYTHAVRDIEPGEELTISYIDALQARSIRQERTRNSLGFPCACPHCTLSKKDSDASDDRLLAISRIESELSDFSSQASSPAMIEEYMSLYRTERLEHNVAGAYTLAALNYNLFGKAGMAKKYAQLSIEAGLLESGPDAADVREMRILADYPKSHWSWNIKPHRLDESDTDPLCNHIAMVDLTIRNLTATPLELKVVERFEGESPSNVSADDVKSLASNLTSKIGDIFNSSSNAVSLNVQIKGEAPDRKDVSILLKPFETCATDIRVADPGREVLRLTFESEGHQYQADVPSASRKSTTMKKINGAPNEYTAIYIQAGGCLSIFSSAHLSRWMGEIRDEYPLTALSIPGTHNSPTCHVALPSVRCQAVGVRDQLGNGVRFLDVRVSVSQDDSELTLVHSAFPIALTGSKYFRELVDTIYSFLYANPSEAIIMSVKREGTGRGTDQKLSKLLKEKFYNEKRWYTDPRIPKLGEVRGKIILLRRHINDESLNREWGGRGWGLDGSVWPDNCEDGRVGSGIARVQDFYEIDQSTNIKKKIEFARKHLERAAEGVCRLPGHEGFRKDAPITPFFINFLSASNFFNANCWPEKIAAKANPAIIEYLCSRHGISGKGPAGLKVGDAATGIVVTDWVGYRGDWDLIRCIVGWNAKLQLKH
ncbi:hypothetical protein E0Z10_g9644 [Xylaria hypoxylon]|uniref:SET domain-containing protein n=1 Tax=Xylaria hypoxylon TaxID=37992 RepID=A0A4Z0Y816_9PEZI|nr:hypothetical protein E0Z10_g9644 [Xylaria hypoxylon]